MTINVTKTYLPKKDKYIKYVEKIFNYGWLTNNGPLVRELEEKLKSYLGVEHLLLVANGTLALQIAYKALNLKGDVLTTPFSFVATTSSLVWEGLNPIFVDINKETLCMDTDKMEICITKNTSAIVPVHVFGNIADVEKIEKIAKKNDLKIIFDAAHAFDVKFKNNSALNFGDISILSFHSTKIFHTIEGGALIFKDKEIYDRAKLLINFGIEGPDKISGLGINCKMNEFEAAMGLCVLEDFDCIKQKRKEVYNYYIELFNGSKDLSFQKKNKYSSLNYSYFPIILKSEKILLKVKGELESNNIKARRYFYPSLDTLKYLNKKQKMPISDDISKRILCLPLYESLEKEMVKKIVDIVLRNL